MFVCVHGFVDWYIGVHVHMFTGVCACVTVCRCGSVCLGECAHVYSCVCVSVCVHAFVGWYIVVHGHMFTGVYDYVKMSASMSG